MYVHDFMDQFDLQINFTTNSKGDVTAISLPNMQYLKGYNPSQEYYNKDCSFSCATSLGYANQGNISGTATSAGYFTGYNIYGSEIHSANITASSVYSGTNYFNFNGKPFLFIEIGTDFYSSNGLNGMVLWFYPLNAVATATDENGNVGSYNMFVRKDPDANYPNDYQFFNLFELGMVNQSTVATNGSGDLSMSYGHLIMTHNPSTNVITLNPRKVYNFIPYYCYGFSSDFNGVCFGSKYTAANTNYIWLAGGKAGDSFTGNEPLTGTLEKSVTTHINRKECAWATNGGTVKTHQEAFKIHFNRMYTYNAVTGDILNILNETDIISGGQDNTLKVDLSINNLGYDKEHGLYVNATISPRENDNLVESYELMVMPGKYSNINDEGFQHCLVNGHVHGQSIHHEKYDTDFVPKGSSIKRASSVNEITVNKLVPYEDLVKPVDDANDFTFYVKVNYSNGLESTFHTMAQFTGDLTGVEDIAADTETIGKISYSNGVITLSNTYGNSVIVSSNGSVVYQGGDGDVTVTPGIYIVRIGKTARKIIAK